MNIRLAEEKDIDSVIKLLTQVLNIHAKIRPDIFIGGTTKYTKEELMEIFNDANRPVYVAVDENDSVMGYAFCIKKKQPFSTNMVPFDSLFIDDLCVDQNIRGKHVGQKIFEHVKEEAKKMGCYEVTLHGTSAEYGEGKVTAMKDGSVLLDEYNKLADNYNRFLELSNSKDTHELRMLRSTVTSTVKRYRQTLEINGFTVNDDNTLSVDSDSLTASAKSGSIFDNLNNLSTFKDALRKRINNIEINPMEYINKKVVAYKNPHKLISSTYSTSIYTGMMFDRSL